VPDLVSRRDRDPLDGVQSGGKATSIFLNVKSTGSLRSGAPARKDCWMLTRFAWWFTLSTLLSWSQTLLQCTEKLTS
jgi:hypothetical protein